MLAEPVVPSRVKLSSDEPRSSKPDPSVEVVSFTRGSPSAVTNRKITGLVAHAVRRALGKDFQLGPHAALLVDELDLARAQHRSDFVRSGVTRELEREQHEVHERQDAERAGHASLRER